MSESMVIALMKLFAIMANMTKDLSGNLSRNFVEAYLKTQFNQNIIEKSLAVYDMETEIISSKKVKSDQKKTSALSVKLLANCNQINRELPIKSRYLILLSLIQFTKFFEGQANTSDDFRQSLYDTVETISDYMKINTDEYTNCKTFINEKIYNIPQKERLLVMSNAGHFGISGINHIQKEYLRGELYFLSLIQPGLILFFYKGNSGLELNGKTIFSDHLYVLPKGSALKENSISPIYYNDIEAGFIRNKSKYNSTFEAKDIEYKFPDGETGIHPLSFSVESGNMMGIMGGSGAGKSTLLKVLTGLKDLSQGKIYFNGKDLLSNRKELNGLIGYVPQDDFLVEELTVYQNLFYNAKLCLGKKKDREIHEKVLSLLNHLDLYHIKDFRVGSPLNKYISGGQRKRLNIALELIKEPQLLFADEPTSGLSSTDSENVLQLLKELTIQGKIVILIIHQPSSELFKMIDQLLVLDKGGFPVYYGNSIDSISYLKQTVNRIDSREVECPYCGNVQPEDVLKIIEGRLVNESGEFTEERMIRPEKWYELYLENIQNRVVRKNINPPNFQSEFNIPSYLRQFFTYSSRNFFSKLKDHQYVLLSLLISPVLAIILSFFTKYVSGNNEDQNIYLFIQNSNLPAYIFMSVIVSLFIGLIISAEDIYKDRIILEREKNLNLSRSAYLNSKILFLFLLSAFQMAIFMLIGNNVLEIKKLDFYYWAVLFSTSCFAVILGLNISSSLKSIIAIYITIPFILVPLILLSGVIVKYDKLHYTISSREYVPVVGDLMASRWAYEALMVVQFKNNKYQKPFFEVDKRQANLSFELNFLIPELFNKISDYELIVNDDPDAPKAKELLATINNTMKQCYPDYHSFIKLKDDKLITANSRILYSTEAFLRNQREQLLQKSDSYSKQKDLIMESMMLNGITKSDLIGFKEKHYNRNVSDLVLNTNEMIKIIQRNGKLIRKDTPIYQYPNSNYGRAQFFSGIKRVGSREIDTFVFNVLVLWIMILFLYINLITGFFGKILKISKKQTT